ncbi:MAG: hypothetical protein CMF62_06300 [Magnetococcales bacterium]|nr:hypothetical protein [Magnetococcales bacterium]|tara:strand:+ start:293624 stop:293905 length:282 start_codon:yes stop_codon:yes gene_type:complete
MSKPFSLYRIKRDDGMRFQRFNHYGQTPPRLGPCRSEFTDAGTFFRKVKEVKTALEHLVINDRYGLHQMKVEQINVDEHTAQTIIATDFMGGK